MEIKKGDLRDLVYHIFEIDVYKSKMGDDADIITLSFVIEDKEPAEYLVNFVEIGYEFVLDADMSKGELEDAKYRVFVELVRDKHAVKNILEILSDLVRLTDLEEIRFRYHKDFKSYPANEEYLSKKIPTTSDAYNAGLNERKKFSKSMIKLYERFMDG